MNTFSQAKAHDLVVFDVDGVLIDTSRSYSEVIVQALLWAWTKFLGRTADCEGFTELHFATTKTHPAFNDDYDIAWAIINCAATAKSSSLSASLPSPKNWRVLLDGCRELDVESWVRRAFGETVSREIVRRVCEELYFGVEEGDSNNESSLLSPRKGLWEKERSMISINWKDIPVPTAIYTGRPLQELQLGLELLGWQDFPPSMIVTSDFGITKPSPCGLALLCKAADATNPLFLGDTESDRRTIQAFERGTFAAIGDFLPHAELIFSSPDDALRYFGLFGEGTD